MKLRRVDICLRAAGALGLWVVATVSANAGGFAIREQSAYGQGASYAGIAAGGSLSSMFWNPATMTQFGGIQSEAVLAGILPYSANTPTSATKFPTVGTGNVDKAALVPAGYFSWQFRPDMWFGLAVTSPYGLQVTFPDAWAGHEYAANGSSLRTYNFEPTFAYRINDMISVGVGLQVQYASAHLGQGLPLFFPIGFGDAELSGHGWGVGFTAGVTVTPTPTTTIGLGYRSFIDQKIDGDLTTNGAVFRLPFSTLESVNTTLKLPDMVSLGIRQRLDPQWTLLGTVEWTNWSRIGTSNVVDASGASVTTLPFQFEDGWFFSLGAEYMWNDRLTVRAGAAFEKSPVTDQVRMPILPDNDRFWLSIGGTYKLTPKLAFDLAYSHIFVKDASINITAASGNPWFGDTDYVGSVQSHIDIISVGLKYRFDEPPAPVTSTLYHK